MIQAITLLVIAALVAIDQVIKIAVVNRFAAGGSMDILFGLIRIRYVENTGAAFSSMQNQTVFLTIFTAVVIVMFIFLLMTKKIKPGFIYWCVAVVIAGGAGNFVDRVAKGFCCRLYRAYLCQFCGFQLCRLLCYRRSCAAYYQDGI